MDARLVIATTILLASCGGDPPSAKTPTSVGSAPPPGAATTAMTAPTTTTRASARPQPDAPRPEAPARAGDGVVLQRCDPFAKAFKTEVEKGKATGDALALVLGQPPSMSAEDTAWCRENFGRLITNDLVEDAGRVTLLKIGMMAKMAYDGKKSLCPSAHPVPTSLLDEKEKYQPNARDWSADPGWSCLKYTSDQPMRLQLEVKADAQKLTIYARHKVAGKLVELALTADVKGGALEIAPQISEQRTPLP